MDLRGGSIAIRPWFTSRNLENVMATVREGLAIGLGPLFMDNEGLIPILAEVVGTHRTVRVLSPRTTADDPRWAAFLRGVDEFIASWPKG